MAQPKKYYWLKLKRDFFKRHDIRIIEDAPNGKDYILFYLKLLCESVDHDGRLRFSESIPYNEEMLSTITNTNIDIVRAAIKVFTGLGMMEIMDDGTYYMTEVQKMIGSAADNDNANRQRRFREKQKQLALRERYGSVTKNNESIEIDKEIKKDIDKEIDISSINLSKYIGDRLTDFEWETLDETYENFTELLDLIDDRLKLSKDKINDPYAYIISVAKAERWATKKGVSI